VGKVSKAKKKKRKLGGGWGENEVPEKKTEIRAEKGLRKGKGKKSTWDGTGIERESYQCTIHHWCTGGCWFTLATSKS
jgi:hypothetical protein